MKHLINLLTRTSVATVLVFLLVRSNVVTAAQTVSITAQNPDGTTLSVPNIQWVENMNVSLAMSSANHLNPKFTFQTTFYYPWGHLVNAIDGFYESSPFYWALYINGTYAAHGIDTQLLNPGDQVLFKVQSFEKLSATDRNSFQVKLYQIHAQKKIDAAVKEK